MPPAQPAPVSDPEDVLAVYLRCPAAHPYGIADVVQLWDRSRWWREGSAVVGLLDLPGSPLPVLYAVAAAAPEDTLALLRRLSPALPGALVATGPVGLADALSAGRTPRWVRDYLKLHLAEPGRLPPPDRRVGPLGPDDLGELEALFATDPAAGDFFHAALLDTGLYVGLREGGDLVAAGGIHVVEPTHGVSAIGNVVTDPARRRRGLGRAVVGALAHRLLERVPVVGLNVRRSNTAARSLYAGLGFRTVLSYEEAELVGRSPAR